MGAPAVAGNVAHVSSDDVDEPSSPKNHGALQDAIMQRVRSTLPHHPVRESLQGDARSMSLQSMCRTYPSSFNRMFGQRVGKPKKRICVRIHKMLNSLISDERPVIPCKSDFCEVDAVDLNGETTVRRVDLQAGARESEGEIDAPIKFELHTVCCVQVHWTCRSGDTNKLHWLIGAGYNLKIKNKKGETGLHIACFSGSDACLEVRPKLSLSCFSFRPALRYNWPMPCLTHSLPRCGRQTAFQPEQFLSPHTLSPTFLLPFKILAASGKFVEEELDALDADGWGALHWAVEQNNLRCVRMMLMHKVTVKRSCGICVCTCA